jgi:hypothetical protein
VRSAFTIVILFALSTNPAMAELFSQSWDPVPNADAYEFEIYDDSRMKKENLVQTGKSNTTDIELDLRPGVYFFRVRSIPVSGRPSPWSAPIRNTVKVSPPLVRIPVKNEVIQTPNATSSVQTEWSSVEGATRYEIRMSSKSNSYSQLQNVLAPSAVFSKAPPGSYTIRVQAFDGDQLLSQSQTHTFSIRQNPKARPRLLFPLDGDTLTAYEVQKVRWTRSTPGSRSELAISRMVDSDRRTLSREEVDGRSWAYTPPLPPGRYQFTIRDFLGSSDESVDTTVTVFVEADPLGQHSESIHANLRLTLGPKFGTRRIDAPLVSAPVNGSSPGVNPAVSAGSAGFFEFRLASRVWTPWGVELRLLSNLGGESYSIRSKFPASATELRLTSQPVPRSKWMIGPTYRWEPLGPHQPLTFKLLAFSYKHQTLLAQTPNGTSVEFTTQGQDTQLQLYGLRFGAEHRWGGWSTRYDVISEIHWDYPFLKSARVLVGRGRVSPLSSSLDSQIFLRRKISSELRASFGFLGEVEHLRIGGSPDAPITIRRTDWGMRIGLDWDL